MLDLHLSGGHKDDSKSMLLNVSVVCENRKWLANMLAKTAS